MGIVEETEEGAGGWVFLFSLETLQKGVFMDGFAIGVAGGGKFAMPEGWRHSVAKQDVYKFNTCNTHTQGANELRVFL